ncbi:MAG: Tat pathway signal protein [Thermodesulfobacteriota bacterium]
MRQLNSSQQQAILNIHPGWEPPRPGLDANRRAIRDNDSGEDFLFMHCQMIAVVNTILNQVGDPEYPGVEGWKQVPPPSDPDYPVPLIPGVQISQKSDNYYNTVLVPWENQYNSQGYLTSVTLGQLGADLEFTIHNDMHVRWAAQTPLGFRPSQQPLNQPVDQRWDDPKYDFLGDTYSSHVNPIFWKLHGWIDDRIENWKNKNRIEEIRWKGTWLGPIEHEHASPRIAPFSAIRTGESELRKLEEVAGILFEAGFDGFFRPMPHP